MRDDDILRGSEEAAKHFSAVAQREIERLKAHGLPVQPKTDHAMFLTLPGKISDIDLKIPHGGDLKEIQKKLEKAGAPFRKAFGANVVHSYTTPEGIWVDVGVRPQKELDYYNRGLENLKALTPEQKRALLLEKHKVHASGDAEAYKQWKQKFYESHNIVPPGGDWSKVAAVLVHMGMGHQPHSAEAIKARIAKALETQPSGIKTAAKWDKVLATMPMDKAKPLYQNVFRRMGGVRPPFVDWNSVTPQERASWVKGIRETLKTPLPELAPRGSQAYRDIWTDIKNKNFKRLETGTNTSAAKNIQQHGPAASADVRENSLPEDYMDRFSDFVRSAKANKRALHHRLRSGIYTVPAGSSGSTGAYASRAATPEHGPAVLSFDLPASLARAEPGQEQIVNRLSWPYARNFHIKSGAAKLAHMTTIQDRLESLFIKQADWADTVSRGVERISPTKTPMAAKAVGGLLGAGITAAPFGPRLEGGNAVGNALGNLARRPAGLATLLGVRGGQVVGNALGGYRGEGIGSVLGGLGAGGGALAAGAYGGVKATSAAHRALVNKIRAGKLRQMAPKAGLALGAAGVMAALAKMYHGRDES